MADRATSDAADTADTADTAAAANTAHGADGTDTAAAANTAHGADGTDTAAAANTAHGADATDTAAVANTGHGAADADTAASANAGHRAADTAAAANTAHGADATDTAAAAAAGHGAADADADDADTAGGLPTLRTLDELADLVDGRTDLYVRWSRGPQTDEKGTSRDELTGVELPGLCANPLAVEDWWEDRPLRTWVARRLFDYRHLADKRGDGIRPWVLEGEELGRGPDNEPIVRCERAIAWIADEMVHDAEAEIAAKKEDWGPLDRG